MSQNKPDTSKRPRPSSGGDGAPPRSEDARTREADRLRRRVTALEETNEDLVRTLTVLNEFRMKLAQLTEKQGMVNRLTGEMNVLDVDRIVEIAVAKIPLLVDAKYASVFFYDKDLGELVLKCHNHPLEINRRVTLRQQPRTVMGMTLQTLKTQLIKDLDEYEREHGLALERSFADRYATRSCVSLPLVSGASVVGVLNLADKVDGGCFDEINDLPLLEQVAQFMGVTLHNCQLFLGLEEQARTDGLTRLHNHRSFHDGLTRELHRCRRYGHRLSLIMCDVDDFKTVNDTLGHQMGDRVIQIVAKLVRSYTRAEDLAARYGGDEFAVILPETPLLGATVVAERIRERVATYEFAREGVTVPVRMSFGVAQLVPGMGPSDLVAAADRALYEAKTEGKNRIRQAGD